MVLRSTGVVIAQKPDYSCSVLSWRLPDGLMCRSMREGKRSLVTRSADAKQAKPHADHVVLAWDEPPALAWPVSDPVCRQIGSFLPTVDLVQLSMTSRALHTAFSAADADGFWTRQTALSFGADVQLSDIVGAPAPCCAKGHFLAHARGPREALRRLEAVRAAAVPDCLLLASADCLAHPRRRLACSVCGLHLERRALAAAGSGR